MPSDHEERRSGHLPTAKAALEEAHASKQALFSWAMYDWANSAFATLIQTFVFAAYFTRSVAENEMVGTAQWGNIVGVAGLLVAVGGPILGAIADQNGSRKPWLLSFTLLCVIATGLLWLVEPTPDDVWLALWLVGVGTLGAEFATVFYNAMLPGLAGSHYIGRWSGWAWSLGYVGGLACLGIALLGFVGDQAWLTLPRESAEHVRATFLLTAGWYLVFSLPLFLLTPDEPPKGKRLTQAAVEGIRQLRDSLRNVRRYGNIVRFLIARMIYIDGLATLFAFGGVYAAGTFGMTAQQVLLFGILLNVTAGLGAAAFAWIDDWIGSKKTILIALTGLIVSGTIVLLVESHKAFWLTGMMLGIFVGPVQAASRSFLGRAAPLALRTEMFGLFAFSGKATAFAGPLLVGWITYMTGSQRIGMSTIVVFFLVGLLLMLTVSAARPNESDSPAQG